MAERPQVPTTFPASILRDTRLLPVFPVSAGFFPFEVRLSRGYSQPLYLKRGLNFLYASHQISVSTVYVYVTFMGIFYPRFNF